MARESPKIDKKYWLKFIDKKNFDYSVALNCVAKNMAKMDHPMKPYDDLGKGVKGRYKRQAHDILIYHGLTD